MSSGRPPVVRSFFRALFGHCPLCGSGGVFARWGHLADRCPRCNADFEREEGYYTGALIINIAGAILLFLAIFAGGLALTWPDVPWAALQVGSMAALGLFPIVFYPLSKTLWVWLDLTINPYSSQERLDPER